ncbi:MAG: polysaccharide deacetylase family protein [Candidatus Roizmanbacteria bacterium]|nr:polysaccharide deacetylase family protein [Candidatus Roizmanbacteria bacterium]
MKTVTARRLSFARVLFISSIMLLFGSISIWMAIHFFNKIMPPPKLNTPYYKKTDLVVPYDIAKQNKKMMVYQPSYTIPIIMYHYVEYVKDQNDTIRKSLSITPNVFDSQLSTLLVHGYTTYFVSDVPKILNGTIPYTAKNIVLTFDDGYEDFYTDAFPILKKNNVKATVYVITNYIGRKGFLSSAQIQELAQSPLVEIGSHTLNHMYLKGGRDELVNTEIVESKKVLENLTGVSVKTFAYPYGAFDGQALADTQEATYSAAVSVIPGNQQSLMNEYYLSRIRAGSLGSGKYMIHFLTSYSITPTPQSL